MCCDSIGLFSSECTLYCDVSHLKMYFIHQQISFIISHTMLPSIDPPRQSLNDKQDRVWLTNKAKVWLSNKAEFDWQTRQSWLANKAEFDWQTRQSLTGKQDKVWLAANQWPPIFNWNKLIRNRSQFNQSHWGLYISHTIKSVWIMWGKLHLLSPWTVGQCLCQCRQLQLLIMSWECFCERWIH